MEFIEPDQAALSGFLKEFPVGKPVVMLNLLKFRKEAVYRPSQGAEPCTGLEAFARYGEAVMPLIAACGGEQVWQGRPAAMLIGPQDKEWHLAVLVRYLSAQAFIDMVTSAEYTAIAFHRTAALEDSRLIAHEEM